MSSVQDAIKKVVVECGFDYNAFRTKVDEVVKTISSEHPKYFNASLNI